MRHQILQCLNKFRCRKNCWNSAKSAKTQSSIPIPQSEKGLFERGTLRWEDLEVMELPVFRWHRQCQIKPATGVCDFNTLIFIGMSFEPICGGCLASTSCPSADIIMGRMGCKPNPIHLAPGRSFLVLALVEFLKRMECAQLDGSTWFISLAWLSLRLPKRGLC